MNIMKRRYLMQALLVASLGAFAATGYAQTNTTTDQTPGSPGAATPAAGTGPAAQRSECQSALTKEYTGIPAPCQKLTGNALDACVHGDYPANAGTPAKTTK
jgi:hypothetical protein